MSEYLGKIQYLSKSMLQVNIDILGPFIENLHHDQDVFGLSYNHYIIHIHQHDLFKFYGIIFRANMVSIKAYFTGKYLHSLFIY